MLRAWVSRTMLCSQKNDATRAPRRHRRNQMQARRRIEHEVPGGQLDVVRAVGVLDDQFAAVIFLGLRQEQRRREVGANPQAREMIAAHGIVDMDAEMVAAVRDVAIEQRRKNPQRDGGREKTSDWPSTPG